MGIELKQVTGTTLDLSVSNKFVYHYNKSGSFAKYILDAEINAGLWYDDVLRGLPDNAVIVDVGANVGLFSLYFEAKQRKFYCVEPAFNHNLVMRDLFDKLGYNAQIFEGVIYNKDGEAPYLEEPQNTTSNKVGDGGRPVKSKTLLTYFNDNNLQNVDLLKLDCEGSEKQIILDDPTIDEALKRCKLIFIETHTGKPYMTLSERDALIEKINKLGFHFTEGARQGSYYFVNSNK
jgi:FkbM family methyltransferase